MNALYFWREKTVLGAKKAKLPFSEGKYQLQNSWNTILSATILYHFNFQLPHPNKSNNVSSHRCPFLKAIVKYEKAEKLHSKPLFYYFYLGTPEGSLFQRFRKFSHPESDNKNLKP